MGGMSCDECGHMIPMPYAPIVPREAVCPECGLDQIARDHVPQQYLYKYKQD